MHTVIALPFYEPEKTRPAKFTYRVSPAIRILWEFQDYRLVKTPELFSETIIVKIKSRN